MSKAPTGGDSWGLAPYLAGAFVIVTAVVFGIAVLFFAVDPGLVNGRKWARGLGVAPGNGKPIVGGLGHLETLGEKR
jgi:hypothetical protein